MTQPSQQLCPRCGEPVQPNWRICPACEARLQALTCLQCGGEVKENWRRCPECESPLLCRKCGTRLGPEKDCPRCQTEPAGHRHRPAEFKDPICGLEMVLVRGGSFAMGDTLDQGIENEQPVHQVTLDDFYIARFPVTQAQWSILADDNPSEFPHPDNPVEQVTWFDAGSFARRLSDAQEEPQAVFMLPTEAQWEYAARSGGKEELYAGGDDIDAVAWYELNSLGMPHPVGQKEANGLGLHDMSGNVWEWCRDSFQADAYSRHGSTNPESALPGQDRVIRGGSWNLDAWSARCARRLNFKADFFGPGLGFRLVMDAAPGNR